MIRRSSILIALLTLLVPAVSFARLVPPPKVEPIGPPLFAVTVKGKSGFMDPKGKIVIEPQFEKATPFSDGLAAVLQQGMWGFIDTQGRVVIKPQFVQVGPFADGLAEIEDKRFPSKWGYIDKTGKIVIQPQFDEAEGFRNGLARVGIATVKGKLLSLVADVGVQCDHKFIDRTGNVVPDPSPLHYATGEPGELIPFMKDDRWGYLDAQGAIAIEPQFQIAFPFSDGLACACQERRFGYIDKRGKWVIPPRYQYANNFSEGLAGVQLVEKGWGIIDRTGKEVIPAKFGWVYDGFRHGVVQVAFEGKSGYINTQGEWVWNPSE